MATIIIPRPKLIKPTLGMRPNEVHELAEGLELCYLFNEGRGTVANNAASSGAMFNGTLVSPAFFTKSKDGDVVDIFSGVATYIEMLAAPGDRFLGPITIFFRANIRTSGNHREMIAKGLVSGGTHSPFSFRADPGGNLILVRANASSYREHSALSQITGITTNYAVTAPNELTESPPTFYVNGGRGVVGTYIGGSASGPVTDNNSIMRIGRRPDNATQLDALVECCYVWSRALSEAQINMLQDNPYCFLDAPSYRTFSYFSGIGSGFTQGISRASQVIIIG